MGDPRRRQIAPLGQARLDLARVQRQRRRHAQHIDLDLRLSHSILLLRYGRRKHQAKHMGNADPTDADPLPTRRSTRRIGITIRSAQFPLCRRRNNGNSWVVLAIVVTVPFCRRPIALPILFALCVTGGRSKPDLGRDLLDQVAEAFPTRTIHLVGDAAYGAGHFAGLGHHMSITTRARSNAVFHHPTPAASGKRGRPRLRGERIGTPTDIANHATKNNTWVDTLINRYGTTITAQTCEISGLWFGVWRTDPVRVILVKDSHRKTTTKKGYDT